MAYQKTSLFVSFSLKTLNSREISFHRRPLTPIIAATVYGMDDEIDDNDKSVTSTFDVAMVLILLIVFLSTCLALFSILFSYLLFYLEQGCFFRLQTINPDINMGCN